MERTDATDIIVTVLAGIAPEIDPLGRSIGPGTCGSSYDLDSMDFMTLVDGVATAAGIDDPRARLRRASPRSTTSPTTSWPTPSERSCDRANPRR